MRRITLVLAMSALLAGCGSGGATTDTTTTRRTTTQAPSNPTAALVQSARSALEQNDKLSGYVLTHNTVPAWASQSTSGPALAHLRYAAAHRSAGRVTVRLLKSALQVRSIHLDPSYLGAVASIVSRSQVRVYQRGHPLGGVRSLNEPSRVELRRVGDKPRFVVWKVELAQ
jgi:hypothetical protein